MSFRQFVHTEGGKGSKAAVIGAVVVAAGGGPSNADIRADISKIRDTCCTDLNSKYRELSKHHHPDKGGCDKDFVALTDAKNAAKSTCSKNTCLAKKNHHKGHKKPPTSTKKDAKRRRKREKRKRAEEKRKRAEEYRNKLQERIRKQKQEERERQQQEKRKEQLISIVGGLALAGGVVASRQQKDKRRRRPLRQNSEEAYEHATGHKKQYKK